MADISPLAALSDSLAALVARIATGVVGISGAHRRSWSGLVWASGVIVTAEEALRDEEQIMVTLPTGESSLGTLAGRDPGTDIAVLRVQGAEPALAEPAPDVAAGNLAVAVGRRGASTLAHVGHFAEIGDAWRSLRGGQIGRLMRLDMTMSGAAEGGPVVDAQGKLVGMAVLGPRGRVLAIPAETIHRIVPRLLTEGSVGRGYLGVGLHPVRASETGQAGAIVISLDANGPAALAGMLIGDLLVSWNGEPIRGVRDIFTRLGVESVGAEVEIGLVRAGNATTLPLHVGRRNGR